MEDEFYIRFEDKFRGNREMIKDRLKVYLPFIEPLRAIYPDNSALDLGCGRGEWLELLQENGWQAVGVDTDRSMVNYCQELEFKASCEDAIAYLHSLESESIAVVSGFHIAEHLPFEVLRELVSEAHRTLLPGGFLILETPNPENIIVGTETFYFDPTHLHPLPAQLLSFLSEYYGFHRTKILRLQEPPELGSSKTTDLLNVLSGVSPDYAIVAQKNARPETLGVFDKEFGYEYGITLETLAQRYDSQVGATTQQLSTEIGDLHTNINGIQTDLSKLGTEQFRLQAFLNGTREDLQGLRVDLEAVRLDLDGLQKKLIKDQADRDALQAELQHVYSSRSYRITAPMRAVFGIARIWKDKLLHPKKLHKAILESETKGVNYDGDSETDSIRSMHPDSKDILIPFDKTVKEPINNRPFSQQTQEVQEMNLDDIMGKIREEVASRKIQNQYVDDFASLNVKETGLFRLIKRIQSILKKFPLYKQIYSFALKFKTRVPKYQQQNVSVHELVKFDGEDFIKNAYKAILERDPDTSGYDHYLYILKTGSLSKVEILRKLRYSPEGQQKRVKIKGLHFI